MTMVISTVLKICYERGQQYTIQKGATKVFKSYQSSPEALIKAQKKYCSVDVGISSAMCVLNLDSSGN